MHDTDEILAEVDREIETTGVAPPDANALVPVDLHGVMTNAEPPVRYVFDPIIPRGEVTLLSGHGGAGKSILALTLAAHAACGRRWGPFEAVQASAVYVSLEDPARRVRSRLRRIIESCDLSADDVIAGLRVFDGSAADGVLAFEQMDNGVRRLLPSTGMGRVAAVAQHADLIVIDNASDAYGGNENERRQVRAFIRMLAALARENDAGLLLAAHIDKASAKYGGAGNNYSGSTAWHNSVRSRLALVSDESGMLLAIEKVQDTMLPEPVRVAFNDWGVLVPQSGRASQAVADTLAHDDASAVLVVIRLALADGQTVSAAKSGSATAWHTLCEYPELAGEYKTAAGRKRVNAALLRLMRDGAIVKTEYRNDNRKLKTRYELAQFGQTGITERTSTGAPLQSPIPPSALAHAPDGARQCSTTTPEQDWRTTGALAHNDDWLANADPEVKATLGAFRAKAEGEP
ncbi:MAG: AAA family ATPase [Rhodanobacteraceae bacterium]|nr:MAG: AAA family ATPase [Rhodanobacteraceae bacterium]